MRWEWHHHDPYHDYDDDDDDDDDDDEDDDHQVGEAILGVFAIFIRDYFTLQWVMSVVTLVQVNSNFDHKRFKIGRLWMDWLSDSCLASPAGVSEVVVEQGEGEGGKGLDDQVGLLGGKLILVSTNLFRVAKSDLNSTEAYFATKN